MGWFTPKLEPGERVVWRYPEARTGWQWAVVVIVAGAFPGAMVGFVLWLASPEFTASLMINATAAGVTVLVFNTIIHMWRLAVTDRRLLVRRSAFRGAPVEIPLNEIEDIRMNIAAGYATVQGGGQEIALPLTQEYLPELEQAIERAKGAA